MSKERAAQLVDAGVWLKLSGDLDGARRLFERALKLDPSNEKAKLLLASPSSDLPPDLQPADMSNPFERMGTSPSAIEREWGVATGPGGTKTPAPFRSGESSLDQDWGRLTGSESPAPQAPPAIPPVTPSSAGLPPPPAYSGSPSQATQQFAMPKDVQAAASSPSTPGTMMFAMPPEVREATKAQASSPSGTIAFAMPDEVRAALGDAPPGATDRFHAMPAVSSPKLTPEDDFQALADEAPAAPPVSSRPSRPAVPPASPAPASRSSPSGTMVAFTMPDEVKAALEQAKPQPSSPSGVAKPVSSPSGTMIFASPSEVQRVAASARAEGDDFDKLAADVEEIPLAAERPSRIVPLPRPSARPAPKPPASKPGPGKQAAPATSPDDWGRLTDEPARAPGAESLKASPSSAGLPPPPAYSSPSQAASTQQFAMPKEVHESTSPPSSGPSGTMQFAMPRDAPGARSPSSPSGTMQFAMPKGAEPGVKPSSPSGTMAFAMPKDVRSELPTEPHPVPQTISLSGEEPPPPPETVVLHGDAPPPEPPRATPPLYSIPEDDVPGSGPRDEIPTAPSMFSAPDPMAAFEPELVPAPPGLSRKPDSPAESAWQWKASNAASPAPLEDVPVPRPSPTLDPAAQSAWDLRAAPGIKLEPVAGADKALDLLSSDSKIQRDPTRAKKDEIAAILRGARDLLDLDDHTGAMELIDKAEKLAPDSPEVRQLKERSERTLLAMFESKLGHLDKVPRVLLKDDEIIWLNLDHRAGFVLAQIDGAVTFEDLFAVSGMSRLDTARILAQLVDEGVISRG
ncbi:MAG: hypothetical protein AB1938_00715 [Myxococcota bacterium]